VTATVATRDPATNLAIAVRRARISDKAAVLAFASRTFDGWDYIPGVWDDWVAASDGVLLVATGQDDDRPIAITRVTILSDTEGWLEGIRVDPSVRGQGVATNLQIAELAWGQAHGLQVIRYLTGHTNEGSLKLGAHHGFAVSGARRYHGRPDDDDGPVAGRSDRPATLDELDRQGMLLPTDASPEVIASAWRVVDTDATFARADRLYEHRPWALQRLDERRFAAHVRAGEVLRDASGSAVGIMPRMTAMAEDDRPHLAILAGDGLATLRLVLAAETASGGGIAVRLPDPDPPMLADQRVVDAWAAAGLAPRAWSQLILARVLAPDETLPTPEPDGALVLRDRPERVAMAPAIGSDR
jgi:GNAT superfamily N-acetyltransferase